MWPFSKKSRELNFPPNDEQHWSVGQGEYEGTVLIVRCNETAGEWAGHTGLPVKLGVAIPFNRSIEGGLPDATESAELGEVEDLIARRVCSVTHGLHALTLTTNVMKELVFYIAPGADIAKLHEDIKARVSNHEVQCVAVEERDWKSYRVFAPGVKNEDVR